jgi:integrase
MAVSDAHSLACLDATRLVLKQHRAEQLEQCRKVGDTWEDRDLVFPDLHGGYFNPVHLSRLFWQLLQKAGIPHMHFHDLRHSAATILPGMGVNMKAVQERLGHSDISIMLGIYGHLLPTMQQDVADKWDDVFKGEEEDDDDDEEA